MWRRGLPSSSGPRVAARIPDVLRIRRPLRGVLAAPFVEESRTAMWLVADSSLLTPEVSKLETRTSPLAREPLRHVLVGDAGEAAKGAHLSFCPRR